VPAPEFGAVGSRKGGGIIPAPLARLPSECLMPSTRGRLSLGTDSKQTTAPIAHSLGQSLRLGDRRRKPACVVSARERIAGSPTFRELVGETLLPRCETDCPAPCRWHGEVHMQSLVALWVTPTFQSHRVTRLSWRPLDQPCPTAYLSVHGDGVNRRRLAFRPRDRHPHSGADPAITDT